MPGGLNIPIEVVLSWPKQNRINPETRPAAMTWINCICGPITIMMLLARLWVRIFHQKKSGWDDWLMVAGTIPTMAYTIMLPIIDSLGFNKHLWDFDLIKDSEKLVTSRKYVLALECIFCLGSGFIKVSILLFYRRLSSRVVSNTFRWTTWISIGYIISFTIALTISPILGCQPLSAFWEQVDVKKKLKGYKFHCFDEGADVFAASVISTTQDLLTAVLPTFLYWNLQIPLRKKIALVSIFALGYGVVAMGGLRVYFSWRTFYETYDITWSSWALMLVSALELHIGAFCANAPTFKVFLKHIFHDKLTLSSKSKSPAGSSGKKNERFSQSTLMKPKLSIFSKVASLFGHSRSKIGYIPDSHNEVSVNTYGGVQVQKEVHVTHSSRSSIKTSHTDDSYNTADLLYDHFYNDLELGLVSPGGKSQLSTARSSSVIEERDITALPPMTESRSSMRAELSSTEAGSFVIHAPQAQRPQGQLRMFAPMVVEGNKEKEKEIKPRTPTPRPSMTTIHRPAEWKSWK
ncbi:hypothetical protein GQ44DRAFT_432071 [Phaeosphaeriaceae sp. PMI808]|nr:hypothetical protein GQ44DRAFT_432071 [Phaeosphaeriaceae sp. PMI808]